MRLGLSESEITVIVRTKPQKIRSTGKMDLSGSDSSSVPSKVQKQVHGREVFSEDIRGTKFTEGR